jgi:hypothetical protein
MGFGSLGDSPRVLGLVSGSGPQGWSAWVGACGLGSVLGARLMLRSNHLGVEAPEPLRLGVGISRPCDDADVREQANTHMHMKET